MSEKVEVNGNEVVGFNMSNTSVTGGGEFDDTSLTATALVMSALTKIIKSMCNIIRFWVEKF